MSKRIHIIVAEPSAIIRCGIVSLLQRNTELDVEIAEVADVSSLRGGIFTPTPDLLIVSPTHLGYFSADKLKEEMGNEKMKIMALQSSFIEQGILQIYDDTISIYDSIDSIVAKINSVTTIEEEIGRKELSAREKEIVVCVVKGMTNKQIAETLYLSTHTVIAHRRNLANKLQIFSPSGLTIYAIVNKLVNIADIKSTITQPKE